MSVVPNLFEFIIAEALEEEGATAESVAAAIACSEPFLRAVRKGMEHEPPPGEDLPNKAQVMRTALGKAFSASTAPLMF